MTAASYNTSDLVDQFGTGAAVCTVPLRNFGGRRAFSGPIRTLKTFEDNAIVRTTLSTPGNGCVLVIDGGGSLRTALVGDVIAGIAKANGWAGIVVWGAVRDSVALQALDFGIKALGTTPRVSAKTGSGHVDITISFGEVAFTPGMWLASDEDGIVILKDAPATD